MGIQYTLEDRGYLIISLAIVSPWTWAEYHELLPKLIQIMETTAQPCATIVDATQIGNFPNDGNFLQTLLTVEKTMPTSMFASVLVGSPYILQVFMNMVMKLRPNAKRVTLFCPTITEAHEQIAARYLDLYR